MTEDTQSLLALFGRLLENRTFASAALRTRYNREDRGQASRGQVRLLHLLNQHDGLTNTEIAVELDIRPSSVSALVKKLLDANFVERLADPDDKRVSKIFLTDDGRAFLKGASRLQNDFSQTCFNGLTDAEQAQLRELLTKLIAGLDESGDDWQDLMQQAHRWHHQFDHFSGQSFGGPWFDRRH
ncbi:MarR family winged helix-turn-helix transcriptional regulator [Lacticaseibacillus porcinae]|uniref:MarR family winged helix-turn-helix transcriptional regulator n=1 Tax=Lacticaseibacillus porcinae TaxID=1123687 RepID=UPI000F768BE7|nr:MarR family transcriptional regulator [Lacticaseibacillus porcinae]